MDMTGYGNPAGAAPAAGPSTNPFDLLTPEEFESLQTTAELDAGMSPPEGEETTEDEASESDEEQTAEDAAGTEMHTPEQMAAIASDAKEAVAGCVADLEAKLVEAEDNEDSDPKQIGKLLKEAQALLADAEDAVADAEDAVSGEDVGAAAEAAAEAERLNEEAHALVAEATDLVGTPPEPEEGAEGAGEGTAGSKPVPPAKVSQKGKPRPAMAVWADRA